MTCSDVLLLFMLKIIQNLYKYTLWPEFGDNGYYKPIVSIVISALKSKVTTEYFIILYTHIPKYNYASTCKT